MSDLKDVIVERLTDAEPSPPMSVKRLYVPFVVKCPCPNCGKQFIKRLDGDNYLSYPSIGQSPDNLVCCYCNDCSTDWQFEYELQVEIKIVGRLYTPSDSP